MDSHSIKENLMREVVQGQQLANLRQLVEVRPVPLPGPDQFRVDDGRPLPPKERQPLLIKQQNMNEECYAKCVPKPGTSFSSGEQTCFTKCIEKYMATWNQVNAAYIERVKQEVARQ